MKNLTLQKFLCELFKFPNLQYMYMIVCIKFLYKVDGLKKLRVLCRECDPDVAITVRKLAMVSLMSVFKDITPR